MKDRLDIFILSNMVQLKRGRKSIELMPLDEADALGRDLCLSGGFGWFSERRRSGELRQLGRFAEIEPLRVRAENPGSHLHRPGATGASPTCPGHLSCQVSEDSASPGDRRARSSNRGPSDRRPTRRQPGRLRPFTSVHVYQIDAGNSVFLVYPVGDRLLPGIRHSAVTSGFRAVKGLKRACWRDGHRLVVVSVPILLSSSSVFPEPTAASFEMAATLGYDGMEVMVWTDAVSQDAGALKGLVKHYGVPVMSVHAPCLLVTQRVWSNDPVDRLRRAVVLADELGATTVVVHPPFTWQRDYARSFADSVEKLTSRHPGIRIAVENMYPVRMARRTFVPYSPGWDPTQTGYPAYTLDVSHCAASRISSLDMADRMGDSLAHIHLGDGTGEGRDEHLVPGRGTQPCAELLRSLADRGFNGSIAIEVATRGARSRAVREAALAESLEFARTHLAVPVTR